MTASVTLTSRPYLGIPIEVVVANSKQAIDSWNYVALVKEEGNKRLVWEWVRDLKTHKVMLPQVTECHAGVDTKIIVEYYVNGGYVATGDLAASLNVTLKNPLRSISARDGGGVVRVTTSLEIMPSNAMLRLATDGIRLSTLRVDREGNSDLPGPRVSGMYDVSFLSGVGSDMALGSTTVQVQARERYTISFLMGGGATQAAATQPNALVQVACGGGQLLRGKDAIFIHKCDDGNISAAPKSSAFQTPLKRCELDSSGKADFQLRDEGIYHVSLALYHEAGTFLCGSRAVLIVSSLSNQTAALMEEPSKCVTPRQATAPPAAAAVAPTDERVMCVVCRDHVIQVKFDPCKHVVVCEGCHEDLKRRGQLLCPMCRARVTSAEKVFIP